MGGVRRTCTTFHCSLGPLIWQRRGMGSRLSRRKRRVRHDPELDCFRPLHAPRHRSRSPLPPSQVHDDMAEARPPGPPEAEEQEYEDARALIGDSGGASDPPYCLPLHR
eukprot:6840248-Pyramimonas_sp.AAC.1